jgi:glycogen(starch) synthase
MRSRVEEPSEDADVHVLRLCSVFEAPAESLSRAASFDVVGGMQVHTARLTSALDELDVRQTVITAYRPGAPRRERLGLRTSLVRAGFPVRHLRQLYGVASIPDVTRAVRPDLVHVHLGEDLAIVPLARWAARRAGAPIVATVHCNLRHTLAAHGPRSAMLRAIGAPMQRGLLGAADAVFVLSDQAAEHLVASGVPASRVRVVPLGVDLDVAAAAPRPAEMDDRPWVVYAGRLVPEKGVRELVDAVERLDGIGLLVIGDGPDRSRLEIAIDRMGATDRIRLLGALPHADVQPYLRHADVVVLPSWFEERGRVLLEAMAAGTPVVAARSEGIAATVRDGVNGLLVPRRAPEALASAIGRVLTDARLAASLAAAGRATAATQPLSALVRDTLDTYRAVLRGPAEDVPAGRVASGPL